MLSRPPLTASAAAATFRSMFMYQEFGPKKPLRSNGRRVGGKIRFRQHVGIHRHIRGSARPATSAPILTYLRRARWLASGRRITLAE